MNESNREYQKAIDYLYKLIESGELTLGSKLPTERYLSEQLSISRNSTREALRMLENMGVIESRRGSGNYLVGNISRTITGVIDMMLLLHQTNKDEICSFRRNMDKSICLSIIENHTIDRWIDPLTQILKQASTMPSDTLQVELDRKFHYTLIQATENQFWITLSEAIADAYRHFIESALHHADESVKAQLYQSHIAIMDSLIKGDRTQCEVAIDHHYNLVDQQLQKEELSHEL
ncbi:transcriptional regulator, GntR family [Lachnospiraceae bacterium KM106-2]|nr:transcriptional regulator, GntR family [Lachnospiraceae bacterium KM106-2]